jgi:SulP family sulfate permease
MPKRVKVHLSADCRQLLHAADDVIDINIIEDPTYSGV